jgi:MerR family transcriptional regulator, redox-sensitive transcriptional activator SoxR
MDELPMGEVARRAGLRPSALRYYERLGLLPSAARHNGQRRYTPAILGRLALIQLAQQVSRSSTISATPPEPVCG